MGILNALFIACNRILALHLIHGKVISIFDLLRCLLDSIHLSGLNLANLTVDFGGGILDDIAVHLVKDYLRHFLFHHLVLRSALQVLYHSIYIC